MKLALRLIPPTIPYAWQEPNRVIELPAFRAGRINVLGFMNRKNDLHAYMFEQSIHTGVVVACFDAFCHTLTKKTVVVVDNAFIHTSDDFADRLPYWKKQGLIVKYLSPYSPELNLIEILWRRIKYTWLPFSAYECLNALIEALEDILAMSDQNIKLLLLRYLSTCSLLVTSAARGITRRPVSAANSRAGLLSLP